MHRDQTEVQIRNLLRRLGAAWKTRNAQEFRSCFSPRARLLSAFGAIYEGKDAIAARFLEVDEKNTNLVIRLSSIQLAQLQPGVGIAIIEGLAKIPLAVAGHVRTKWRASAVMALSPDGEWYVDTLHASFVLKQPRSWFDQLRLRFALAFGRG